MPLQKFQEESIVFKDWLCEYLHQIPVKHGKGGTGIMSGNSGELGEQHQQL